MKWVFVRKHFLNQQCCVKSTLSNTYTRNAAQYTHSLNSSLHSCAYLRVFRLVLGFLFCFFSLGFPFLGAHVGSGSSRRISSRLRRCTASALRHKTFQRTLAGLKRKARRSSSFSPLFKGYRRFCFSSKCRHLSWSLEFICSLNHSVV